MLVFEGLYGTSKSSYLAMENAKMIVRHSQKVDETKAGARSRYIESIMIENALGERSMFPTKSLAPARAMTQHVNKGGNFHDTVGKKIIEMSHDFSNLNECSSYINVNGGSLSESAHAVREQCRGKIREMKKVFEKMYRSDNGYMAEAKKIEDECRTLNETDVEAAKCAPEKIEEMRKTLNLEGSSYLSDSCLESVCKLCQESEKEGCADAKVTEAAPAVKTVSVLGRQVNTDTWEKLKQGQIELMGKPKVDARDTDANPSGYLSKSDEMIGKLSSIVPLIRDDSLMNLMAFVVDRLPDEEDKEVANKMRKLSLFVIKAAGISMNEGLSESNKVVRNFGRWVSDFSVKKLAEGSFDMNPFERDDSASEEAISKASSDFSPEEFEDSEAGKGLLKWSTPTHDPEHSEEDAISMSDLKSSLESFFTKWIETHTGEYIEDTADLADEKMGEVIAHLARKGYLITGSDEVDESEHDIHFDDDFGNDRQMLDDCDMMEDDMEGGEELTREDVLLPHPNQGESLAREVTPRTVKDPTTGKEVAPDSGYINRLRTLSGVPASTRQF